MRPVRKRSSARTPTPTGATKRVSAQASPATLAGGGGGGAGAGAVRELTAAQRAFLASSMGGDADEPWPKDHDEALREHVLRHGEDWPTVAAGMAPYGQSLEACRTRWNAIKAGPVKGPWTREEDKLLTKLVAINGPKKWSKIAESIPGRVGKQCRERWLNHLDTNVKKSPWTPAEDQVLMAAQERIGNRWSEIAKLLPGRAENAVKNRYNSIINRRWSEEVQRPGAAADPWDSVLGDVADLEDLVLDSQGGIDLPMPPPVGGGGPELDLSLGDSNGWARRTRPDSDNAPEVAEFDGEFRDQFDLPEDFDPVPLSGDGNEASLAIDDSLGNALLQLSISPSGGSLSGNSLRQFMGSTMSPTARQLQQVSNRFREGRLSSTQKNALKEQIINQSQSQSGSIGMYFD